MFLSLIILVIILFLLLLLSMVWPPDSPWAPWWRTNTKTAEVICALAKITEKDIIYDLGCGDGEVLIHAGKIGAKGVGIEIDPLRVFTAKARIMRNNLSKKILIKRSNFFSEDISKASVIIVYLIPKTLEKLIPKFKKELKKGTRIVSYVYEIKGLKVRQVDKKNKLRLYIL
jgi:ribosomal protein L11 methylase PrmA